MKRLVKFIVLMVAVITPLAFIGLFYGVAALQRQDWFLFSVPAVLVVLTAVAGTVLRRSS